MNGSRNANTREPFSGGGEKRVPEVGQAAEGARDRVCPAASGSSWRSTRRLRACSRVARPTVRGMAWSACRGEQRWMASAAMRTPANRSRPARPGPAGSRVVNAVTRLCTFHPLVLARSPSKRTTSVAGVLTTCHDSRMDEVFPLEDGVGLNVVRSGAPDAPVTVVLAHGYALDHRSWQRVVPELAHDELQVVAYDHRGHGQSGPATPETASIEQLGDDLAELTDRGVA